MNMKSKVFLSALAVVAFVAGMLYFNFLPKARAADGKILYYTCFMHPTVKSAELGSCPICGMGLEPVYASDMATNNAPAGTTNSAPANAKPTPYPLTTCVVSGEKLGEMGEPIAFVYTNNGANQEVKFCCPMCKPKFLKDPDKYMKIIKEAEAKK